MHLVVSQDDGMVLDCGARLKRLTVAYRTYGRLNAQRSNAVLACHALTGDQYVAELHPVTGKEGWWESVVGPGRPIDTDRYFVICANVLGGCMGSTGPASIDPETAAGLASNLRAALPRIRELLGLLTRRGKEDG